jgi:cellulose synthase operon protein C
LRRCFWNLAAAVCMALAATAVGAARHEAGSYYEDALRRYDQGDVKGAIIQLKNALQQDSKLLSAQMLLGEAYLKTGAPAAAEVAFVEAEKVGADRSLIAPKLAQALYLQFKFQPLLDRIRTTGLPSAALAEVQTYRAYALLELGQTAEALQAIAQAKAADPGSIAVKVGEGTILLRSGDLKSAAIVASQLVREASDDAAAWNLHASVAHLGGNVKEALAAYGKALEIEPRHLDARIARASLLLDLGRDQEAQPDLDYLAKEYAGEPRAAYLTALAAARKGDSEATRKALANVTAVVDQIPTEIVNRSQLLLMLGGLAHYGLNEPEKAKGYLANYTSLQPRQPGARKLLAAILLTEGEYNRVIDLLDPVVKRGPGDPHALALLASAYMGRKEYQRASRLLEEAAELSGGEVGITTSLGLSQLGAGDAKLGLSHLEHAYRKDPTQTRTGIALAVAYLRTGDHGRAVTIARQVVKREPSNPLAHSLLGDALLAGRDWKGARAAYEQAARDKNFIGAQVSLARLDMLERKWDAARQRLDALLKKDANNVAAMFEMARLEDALGRSAEAIRWLDKARVQKGAGIRPALYLVELYIRAGEGKKALSVATELEAAYPQNFKVLAAVGRAHFAAGDVERARVAFHRLSRYAAYDTPVLYEVAQLFLMVNDPDAAYVALDKAVTNNAKHLPSQALLTEVELRTGRIDAAEKRARFVRETWPGLAAGYRLLGGVLLAKKQFPEALANYKAACERDKTSAGAVSLYQAYLNAGEVKAGNTFMESWLRARPNDHSARLALAEGYFLADDLGAARAAYEALLKVKSDDVTVLNNLANIMDLTGDAQALTYARKAHQLSPNDPLVLDTLGWLLVRQGQPQQALSYLRDAHLRAARNAEIRYHLGVALYRLGRKTEAKRELQAALSAGDRFKGAEEARALLHIL